jgi:segregation and condensation protein A
MTEAREVLPGDGADDAGESGARPTTSDDRLEAVGSYAVKLSVFEGPLDLLLHLIRINEVDISDIPIALISEQYLQYLELMRDLDIDVAAEYLVMAATLAHIKSRMLLPPEIDGEDGEQIDPRAELARRLAEYAVFKEAALDLGRMPRLGRDFFDGEPDLSAVPESEPVLAVSMLALVEAMRRVLAEIPPEERHHAVVRESITIGDRMVTVMDRLRAAPHGVEFEDLLRDGEPTRHRILITFLAILELARRQVARLFQNSGALGQPEGPIRVFLRVIEEASDAATEPAAETAFEPDPDLEEDLEEEREDEEDGHGGFH